MKEQAIATLVGIAVFLFTYLVLDKVVPEKSEK